MPEELKPGAGAPPSDDKGNAGEKVDYATKEEMAAIGKTNTELTAKVNQLTELLTSPTFMQPKEVVKEVTPAAAPKVEPTQKDIDDFTPAQTIGYALEKVAKLMAESNKRVEASTTQLAGRVDNLIRERSSEKINTQIEACRKEFGTEEFNAQWDTMTKIAEAAPGITARRAYLIATGEANPPKRAPIPTATSTEKAKVEADFKAANLSPKDAAEKALELIGGVDAITFKNED